MPNPLISSASAGSLPSQPSRSCGADDCILRGRVPRRLRHPVLVVRGPDAFSMSTIDFEDFPVAMKNKLLRELSPRLTGGFGAEFTARRTPSAVN
jgi:hypothetical protein